MTRFLAPMAVMFLLLALTADGRAADDTQSVGEQIFGVSKVVRFHLKMTPEQFAALAPAARNPFGPPGFGPPVPQQPAGDSHRNTFGVEFPWSRGDVTCDGRTYTGVGVRYKGNYTYMATARSLKKSMKLDFNRHTDGQRLDGLTMVNLHCGVSDPSRVREALSYAVFRAAGVPAPRTAYCELTLTVPGKYDHELVGVYTLTEQVNRKFLKQHFPDGSGMLLKPEGLSGGPAYQGNAWKPYGDRYRPEDPPSDEQKQRLIDFTKLVSQGTDEEFARDIGSFLEMEAFLKFIAANVFLSNLDSYLGYGHNYYLYLNPRSNQFVFIPWDLDLSLATWPAVGTPEQLVDLSIHHPHAGDNKLLDRIFSIPTHKDRYLALLKDFMMTRFTRDVLLAQLDEIDTALKESLALDAKAVAAREEGRGATRGGPGFGNGQFGQSMPPRRFIDLRIKSVVSQLEGNSRGFEPKPVGGAFGPPRPPRPGRGRTP